MVVYQSVRAVGFEPVLYLYYEVEQWDTYFQGALVDKMNDFFDRGTHLRMTRSGT